MRMKVTTMHGTTREMHHGDVFDVVGALELLALYPQNFEIADGMKMPPRPNNRMVDPKTENRHGDY